jgi:hypothetical protein
MFRSDLTAHEMTKLEEALFAYKNRAAAILITLK